eukprot:7275290-Pyramimonas_sp.AAC.1
MRRLLTRAALINRYGWLGPPSLLPLPPLLQGSASRVPNPMSTTESVRQLCEPDRSTDHTWILHSGHVEFAFNSSSHEARSNRPASGGHGQIGYNRGRHFSACGRPDSATSSNSVADTLAAYSSENPVGPGTIYALSSGA